MSGFAESGAIGHPALEFEFIRINRRGLRQGGFPAKGVSVRRHEVQAHFGNGACVAVVDTVAPGHHRHGADDMGGMIELTALPNPALPTLVREEEILPAAGKLEAQDFESQTQPDQGADVLYQDDGYTVLGRNAPCEACAYGSIRQQSAKRPPDHVRSPKSPSGRSSEYGLVYECGIAHDHRREASVRSGKQGNQRGRCGDLQTGHRTVSRI